MARPGDWQIGDLMEDPTPGEPTGVRQLALAYDQIARSAAHASGVLRRVGRDADDVWQGQAAEQLVQELADLPDDVGKVASSFGLAAEALTAWAARMELHQAQADRHLHQARAAAGEIEAAKAVLARLDVALDGPARVAAVRQDVSEAEVRLERAQSLLQEAKAAYEADARTAIGQVEAAQLEAVPAYDWWQKVMRDDAWQAVAKIAVVAGTALALVSVLASGPAALCAGVVAAMAAADQQEGLARFGQGDGGVNSLCAELAQSTAPVDVPPDLVETIIAAVGNGKRVTLELDQSDLASALA